MKENKIFKIQICVFSLQLPVLNFDNIIKKSKENNKNPDLHFSLQLSLFKSCETYKKRKEKRK